MSSGLVSIIIPVFNREVLITKTLDTVIKQSYTNWECIIVDDGSHDNTLQVVSKYIEKDKRISLYNRPNESLKGANACRNFGLKKSKGEYIQFFDSDDLMHKEHITKKVNALKSLKDKDYVICRFNTFTDSKEKEPKNIKQYRKVENIYQDYILGHIAIFTFSILWRRKIFKTNIVFDEQLQQFQDLDLYSKIIYSNRNYELIDQILIHVRRNNESITTVNNRLDIKTDSFITVKNRILDRTPDNQEISLFIIKNALGVMRYKMAAREYSSSDKCLAFIKKYSNKLTIKKRVSLFKITVFYSLFKLIKSGDTKFKSLLKL